jgi:hypothetical protein
VPIATIEPSDKRATADPESGPAVASVLTMPSPPNVVSRVPVESKRSTAMFSFPVMLSEAPTTTIAPSD